MRIRHALGVVCASVGVALALSACSSGRDEVDTVPSEQPIHTVYVTPTARPSDEAYPSFPAGIPTAEPSPPGESAPTTVTDLVPRLTIAEPDQMSGGMMVGGFVNGVVEDGGDCQFIITGASGSQFIAQTVGVENVGSTSCGSTLIPAEQVPPGTYSVVLRYVSDRGDARSDAISVRVQ